MGPGSGGYANSTKVFKGLLCFQCNMSMIFKYLMFKSLFSSIS